MTEAARGYLVRDAETTGKGRKVDQIYPYTLRGLTEALEEARFRSHSGAPQVLAILGTGNTRVIRRFEDGREVPMAPLPRPRGEETAAPQPLGRSGQDTCAVTYLIFWWTPEKRLVPRPATFAVLTVLSASRNIPKWLSEM
jgi:hypothetical protein